MPSSPSDREPVLTRVREVVDRLAAREPELSGELTAAVESGMDHLEHVDPEVHGLLHGAVADNVEHVLKRMQADLPPEHDEISPATLAYAEELARHEVPSLWLRRAYHLATDALLSEFFTVVEALDCPGETKLRVFHHLASWLHGYVDCATRLVIAHHERALASQEERHLTEVSAWVRRVLDAEPVDAAAFAAVTGHALDRLHLGAVLWIHGAGHGPDRSELLRAVARDVGRALDCPDEPLVVPVGRTEAWVWFTGESCRPWQHAEELQAALARATAVRVALGSPGSGADGFRRTLEQARGLRLLAQVVPTVTRQVLSHDDEGMAVVAMLAQDLPAARRWVHDTLGTLADDSEAAQRLRETVRIFLSTGSYAETAEQLQLHRNTVKYRLTKVARDRDRELTDGRLDLELALQVCHVLGASVLARDPEPTG